MVKIIIYLVVCLLVLIGIRISNSIFEMPTWYKENILFIYCSMIGTTGGILYCFRGIYLNKCLHQHWDETWNIWYYLRPITSGITGFISCIFFKAGIITLDAQEKPDLLMYGYLALAFIAGYNVDNFLKKLETIAQDIWGIKKSYSSEIGNGNIENKGNQKQ